MQKTKTKVKTKSEIVPTKKKKVASKPKVSSKKTKPIKKKTTKVKKSPVKRKAKAKKVVKNVAKNVSVAQTRKFAESLQTSASDSQVDRRSELKTKINQYSLEGENFNIATHAIALGMAIVAGIFLMVKAFKTGSNAKITGAFIFSITNVLLYLSSTMYHSVVGNKIKLALKKIDHSAIFIFIAGSYTPYLLTWFSDQFIWVLYFVWLFAFAGIALKFLKIHTSKIVSATPYLVMGLMAIIGIKPLYDQGGSAILWYILGGGAFYVGGVFIYVKKTTYSHGLWHLSVLAGNVCHFMGIYYLVI